MMNENEVKKMKSDEKLWAILSYIFILWFVPLWVIKPRLNFAVYHAKQAFGLFLTYIVLWVVFSILLFPMLFSGLYFLSLILNLIYLGMLVLWIFGLVYAATEKEKPIPILGEFYLKIFKNL